jgi:translation initiation factor 2 beta subunit (eIF-2beta)/eIF-5
MKHQALQKAGQNLSLEEIEAFANSLKTCPKCGSNEGFWLAANREKSYAQCKHCGAVLEFCEVLSYTDKDKRSRSAFKKLKF